MATIRFYTRSKFSDHLAPVWLRFTDGRKINIRITTPFRLFPSYWNESKQALKQRVNFNNEITEQQAKDILDKFEQLRDAILREHFTLSVDASKEWLNDVVNKFYYKQDPSKEDLNSYIERFIREATLGTRLCNTHGSKNRYSEGTLRNFRDFQNAFDLFQGMRIERNYGVERKYKREKVKPTRPCKPLNWQNIDIDFYNEFLKYFYDKNCSDNYIGKHLGTLKAILRQAKEEGMPVSSDIEKKAFKVISSEVDNIYLTADELQRLYDVDLSSDPKNKHLLVARDVFLCGCYLAQRYSDYSKICKDNIKVIDGIKFIEVKQKKTKEKCIIPIRPELDTILNRYDYTLPKTYEQKINDYIKIIGEMAKINEVIHYDEKRGGLTIKKKDFKYDLIKTHTARRTGCTLMFLAGIPTITIMRLSGHKTESEFLKYICVTKEQTAVNLNSHPYFAGNVLKVVPA